MAFIAFLLGILTMLVGGVGVVAPSALGALTAGLRGPLGLVLATGFRLLLGAALFIAAPASRAPYAFRALGAATFAVGLVMPLIGIARFEGLIDWWATLDPWLARAWCGSAVLVGAAIAYGIIPRDAR